MGDPNSASAPPPPAGKDLRLKDVNDPSNPEHANYVKSGSVAVSGVTVIAVDTYDETGSGKSTGTIYVQDLGSKAPYAGTSLFAPSFVPGNLHVGAGDVLDLRGGYQENANIGTAIFAPGAYLTQFARPTATFRLELANDVEPTDIDLADLQNYDTGRKWLNMLVRVKAPVQQQDISKSKETGGRLSITLLPKAPKESSKCQDPFPKAPTLTNELFDVGSVEVPRPAATAAPLARCSSRFACCPIRATLARPTTSLRTCPCRSTVPCLAASKPWRRWVARLKSRSSPKPPTVPACACAAKASPCTSKPVNSATYICA